MPFYCVAKIALVRGFAFLCLLLFLAPMAHAQSDKDKRNFKKAIKFLDENKPEKASAIFLELLPPGNSISVFSPQIEYLAALSLYKQRKFTEARDILNIAVLKESDLSFKSEAGYLLSCIEFELGNSVRAMQQLSRLPSWFGIDADNMKRYFLATAKSDSVRLLYTKNGKDRVVNEILAAHLAVQPIASQDRPIALELVKKVNSPELQTRVNDLLKEAKGVYKIALLLPLNYKGIKVKSAVRSNQFVIDLLEGIQVAAAALVDSGIGIELFIYDTERNTEKVAQLLQYPEMLQMDMLVGPIYSQGASLMADFAAKNHIVMVNPLSNKMAWEPENEFAFITEPSLATVAKKLSDYAIKNLDISKTSVVYGTTVKDSVLAHEYRKQINDAGGQILLFRKVGKNSAANLIKFIKEAEIDSSGHIFVPNSEPLVNVQLMSALQVLKLKNPIIAYDEWLTSGNHSLEQLERQNVSFIYPDFIDREKAEVKQFNEIYKSRMNLMPSKYALIGYDMLNYFCQLMARNKGHELNQAIRNNYYTRGRTLQGYLFSSHPDNQVVPVYKLIERQLTLVSE